MVWSIYFQIYIKCFKTNIAKYITKIMFSNKNEYITLADFSCSRIWRKFAAKTLRPRYSSRCSGKIQWDTPGCPVNIDIL